MSTNWNALAEEHELAYLRGDLATSSPESYSFDEMKAISDGMFESTAKVDAALKADFESLPPEAQGMLLDMLCVSGCMTPEFWKEMLLGKMPSHMGQVTADG
jgi:hypothetical protein